MVFECDKTIWRLHLGWYGVLCLMACFRADTLLLSRLESVSTKYAMLNLVLSSTIMKYLIIWQDEVEFVAWTRRVVVVVMKWWNCLSVKFRSRLFNFADETNSYFCHVLLSNDMLFDQIQFVNKHTINCIQTFHFSK